MASLPRNEGVQNVQDTELVIINSSPIRLAGLIKPHVLKRRDDQYMLPPSPSLPTLNAGNANVQPSRKRVKGSNGTYTPTNVSELEVEHIRLHHTLWGNDVPQARAINLRKAPLFNPLNEYTTSFSQLHSLDMLPARGLKEVDFWKLFAQCQSCLHLVTTRTIPYHICPAPGNNLKNKPKLALGTGLDDVLQSRAHFMWLLDAHNMDHATGVPENVFRSIFYICKQCGRYMTQRVSRDHHEDADLEDYTCINAKLAKSLKAKGDAMVDEIKAVTREFPHLEPL